MNEETSKPQMRYEDRCEAIRYTRDAQSLRAYCTHGAGSRLFASSVAKWDQTARALSDAERLHVIKHILGWMSEPSFFRRLFRLPRKSVILVVDETDALRLALNALPRQLSSSGTPVVIEADSLQHRKDVFDAMVLSLLRNGKSSVVIHGKKVSTPEEFLAISDRHEGFVK